MRQSERRRDDPPATGRTGSHRPPLQADMVALGTGRAFAHEPHAPGPPDDRSQSRRTGSRMTTAPNEDPPIVTPEEATGWAISAIVAGGFFAAFVIFAI